MKKLYYIETGNRFAQVLIFTSKATAKKWAERATRWTAEEIADNIHEIEQDEERGFFSLFPTY